MLKLKFSSRQKYFYLPKFYRNYSTHHHKSSHYSFSKFSSSNNDWSQSQNKNGKNYQSNQYEGAHYLNNDLNLATNCKNDFDEDDDENFPNLKISDKKYKRLVTSYDKTLVNGWHNKILISNPPSNLEYHGILCKNKLRFYKLFGNVKADVKSCILFNFEPKVLIDIGESYVYTVIKNVSFGIDREKEQEN